MGTQGADGDMVPGDSIEVEISGIGTLKNYVVAKEYGEEPIMSDDTQQSGLAWQITTWNQMADLYATENAPRIAPVAGRVVAHAALTGGEQVLDIGTGTGIILELASPLVGSNGHVVGIDISPEMLTYAQSQVTTHGLTNVSLRESGAEAIPADDNSFDVVLASLSFMYVVDRAAAAKEIARVLRPGGRLVGSVWTGPEQCDLVRFQQIAGRFAAAPPVLGVGPGALSDSAPFIQQLSDAGIDAHVEKETLGFDIDSFAMAWDVFAGVTTASLSPERQQEAREAVFSEMWPDGEGPRHFRNGTQFIIGRNAA